MATARKSRARLIPLVQRLSFGTRLASGWTVAATEDDGDKGTAGPPFARPAIAWCTPPE